MIKQTALSKVNRHLIIVNKGDSFIQCILIHVMFLIFVSLLGHLSQIQDNSAPPPEFLY